MNLKVAISQFAPLLDFLLIERDKVEDVTENGIILPEASKVPASTGKVLAAGPDTKLPVGTRILFGKYAGTSVTIQNTDYILMPEKEAIAVIRDPSSDDAPIGGVANG